MALNTRLCPEADSVVKALMDGAGRPARELMEAPQYYAGNVAYMRPEKFARTSPRNFDSYALLGQDSAFTYVVSPLLTVGFAYSNADVAERSELGMVPVLTVMLRDSGYRGYRQAHHLRIREAFARLGVATNWYLLFVQSQGGIVSDFEHLEGGRLLWRSLVDKAEARGFHASLLDRRTEATKPVSAQTPDSEVWAASPAGRDLLLVLER